MIAIDTNILVYAHRVDSPYHEAARDCVSELAEDRSPWAIPWPCLHEFWSTCTHPRGYVPASTREQAIAQIEAWLSSPTLVLIHETKAHWSTLRRLVDDAPIVGARIHDARIAAICLQHGVRELWSADRDFKRFPALKVRNPLRA